MDSKRKSIIKEPSPLDISIIICTLNRSHSLRRVLESLLRLNITPDLDYEVLLIDNGSTDNTHTLLTEFVKNNPRRYRYFFQPQKGKSRASNTGIENARGDIAVFTDDDVTVDSNWIQAFWNAFQTNENVIAVQGKILLQEQIVHMPEWVDPGDLLFCPYYAPSSELSYCDRLVGANMAIRRTAFEKYGFFDPRLGAGASGLGEETEFCMRLKEGGEKILYQPDAVVFHEYHEERFTWEFWCKRIQQQAHSNAIIDILLKQERMCRVRNQIKLGRYYIKYFLHSKLYNRRKKYKYDRRIRYMKDYIKFISEIRENKDYIPEL